MKLAQEFFSTVSIFHILVEKNTTFLSLLQVVLDSQKRLGPIYPNIICWIVNLRCQLGPITPIIYNIDCHRELGNTLIHFFPFLNDHNDGVGT